MANSTMKFDDLEYIVMEGGGARGAAYLGAIRALEKKMIDRFLDAQTTMGTYEVGNRKAALMDFYFTNNNNPIPVLKGIAGSSAGAITTFALSLGLNSDEIENILKEYPFKNFLKNEHAGVYRTIRSDGSLGIGQDKRNNFFGTKELDPGIDFRFNFNADFTPITPNPARIAKRDLLVGTMFKVVTDGLLSNLQQIGTGVGKWFNIESPDEVPGFWRKFFKFLYRPNNNFLARAGLARILRTFLFQFLIPAKILKVPINLNTQSLTATLFDRGMYSGFAVREFFMDMLIFAATRRTQFHRGLVKFIESKNIGELQAEFGKDVKGSKNNVADILLSYENKFAIGKRAKSKIGDDADLKLTLLCMSRLNFSHFQEIIGINFGACVANFSTGLPIYFGHEWTPDFPVMEAVAASMSIPPAIKPIYNESNVVVKIRTGEQEKPLGVDLHTVPFVNNKGEFEMQEYYLHEQAVKIALQQLINKDKRTENTFVHMNNSIDISAFLPKLRDVVNGEYDTNETEVFKKDPELDRKVEVEIGGEKINVNYAMFKFFYNACYKGLLLDGGYRNNIPYNFFRLRNENINTVLAIKLDESFPPDLLDDVNRKITDKLNKVRVPELVNDLDEKPGGMDLVDQLMEQMEDELLTEKHKITKALILQETRLIFTDFLKEWEKKVDDSKQKDRRAISAQLRKDEKAIKRLAKEAIKKFRKKHLTPPWKSPVSMLMLASDGYSFGSEKGQVKQISDHNHILPLYDYGIGTYDFDMDKVRPLIDLAQDKAEEEIMKFFNPAE